MPRLPAWIGVLLFLGASAYLHPARPAAVALAARARRGAAPRAPRRRRAAAAARVRLARRARRPRLHEPDPLAVPPGLVRLVLGARGDERARRPRQRAARRRAPQRRLRDALGAELPRLRQGGGHVRGRLVGARVRVGGRARRRRRQLRAVPRGATASAAAADAATCKLCFANGSCVPVPGARRFHVARWGYVNASTYGSATADARGLAAMQAEIHARGPIVCSMMTDDDANPRGAWHCYEGACTAPTRRSRARTT